MERGHGSPNRAPDRPANADIRRRGTSFGQEHAATAPRGRERAPYAAGAAVPNTYRNKESMGWHFAVKRDYINRKACDITISVHENAGGLTSAGMAMLVGNSPPADQVRTAKLFMKYVDPFDQRRAHSRKGRRRAYRRRGRRHHGVGRGATSAGW